MRRSMYGVKRKIKPKNRGTQKSLSRSEKIVKGTFREGTPSIPSKPKENGG